MVNLNNTSLDSNGDKGCKNDDYETQFLHDTPNVANRFH